MMAPIHTAMSMGRITGMSAFITTRTESTITAPSITVIISATPIINNMSAIMIAAAMGAVITARAAISAASAGGKDRSGSGMASRRSFPYASARAIMAVSRLSKGRNALCIIAEAMITIIADIIATGIRMNARTIGTMSKPVRVSAD